MTEQQRPDPRFRRARRDDVPAIVRLLADDPLGAGRETLGEAELPAAYWRSFDAIDADPTRCASTSRSASAPATPA